MILHFQACKLIITSSIQIKDSVGVGFRTDDQILGNISNDPLFGKTNAKMFLELKPESYPWSFSEVYNKDSLYIDSVVLVLGMEWHLW